MTDPNERRIRRSTYRHGDLRQALLTAGIELARVGGPDAVVLREATRQVGVAPNAAYRHFADRQALLAAVCAAALSALADAIQDELSRGTPPDDPHRAARFRLRAVGTGYVRFAQEEPGLFRTAFSVPASLDEATASNRSGARGLTPFQLLTAALDGLVEAGALPPDRRPAAEYLAWSAVHGLAVLLIDGPLRSLDPAEMPAIADRLVEMIERGL